MSTKNKLKLKPIIDHNRCKGKGICVVECTENVLKLRKLTKEENKSLTRGIKFIVYIHGGKQAFVSNSENCVACGTCVKVCPKKAIKLHKA